MQFRQADIEHYQCVEISPLVRRMTAGNSGIMTGPGTNTYIVGREQLALIDPGPLDERHIDALLKVCGDRLRWIIATHTHSDHSPAAKPLSDATGAQVLGNVIADDGKQDKTFAPARSLQHDEVFATDEFRLRALLTPGHVGNHVCFLLEDEGLLFTGDHVMEGTTVVVIPPSGDMREYIASLRMLANYPLNAIAPAHGKLIFGPQRELERLVRHRLMREAKVVSVMQQMRRGSLDEITPPVYNDVQPHLHPIARYSLWAHLLKLQREGSVDESDGEWRWTGDK
ncbi:MAG TPA: MBL fold metallo-hydrolase [Spongiibacteraceae bacterium]|nr:MBL fold metallo-hydrolase [Spongiibacteraceae bacterium]